MLNPSDPSTGSIPPSSQTRHGAAEFLRHDTPVSLTAGQYVIVNLRVRNAGPNTWACGGENTVHVGYRWFNAGGQQQLDVEDHRTLLPHDVPTNYEAVFGAILFTPKTPGAYRLCWDLSDSQTWFSDAGSRALVVPVFVTALPRDVTGWRVESNVNVQEVAHALDGDPKTYWDSRVPQISGQWFRLNLSAPRLIDGIQFHSPGKGFPSGYALNISADGRTWSEIARMATDNRYDVLAAFAPQPVQYAQIDLLTASPSSWMISEIVVHPATGWKADASHNQTAAYYAIDNRADTAWSSEAPQEPGMWFQLDLGRAETVSGLRLIPPWNENPVGFRITTWDTGATRWQVVYEQLNSRAVVDAAFAATETQFLNIQLLQAGDRAWAIQQALVFRAMGSWLGPSTQ